MSLSLNDRFSQVASRNPRMNSRVVSCKNSGSVQITVVNDYSPLGPPPSVCRKQKNHLQSSGLRKPTSGCNSSITNPPDVIRKSDHNRRTEYKPPGYYQINHIGLNGPVYNSPHGPITDLRQLLTNRRTGANQVSDTGSYPHRNFRAPSRRSPRTQGSRSSSGLPRQPPSETWFGRRGQRGSSIRGAPPPPPSALPKSNSFARSRGRQYWTHDDRHEPQRCSHYPAQGMLDTHVADEYIDDFNPEDLAKYKLEIDMDGFTVHSPLLSDPILSMPLSQWNADDLYYSSFLEQETRDAYNSRSQTAKQRAPRTRRPFGHRRTHHPPRVHHEAPKSTGKSESASNHPSVAQEFPNAQTDTEYLKPAFQLWMDSGLGTVPKQRHTSEITLRLVPHRTPFELYPSLTWPTLRVTMSSCIPTPGSSVCEPILDNTTNRRCLSMPSERTQSSGLGSHSCHPPNTIRSHSA